MNNLLAAAAAWFSSMDIGTFDDPSGLRVRKEHLSNWGTSDEVLAELKEAMTAKGFNGKKLAWNRADEKLEWFLLASF